MLIALPMLASRYMLATCQTQQKYIQIPRLN